MTRDRNQKNRFENGFILLLATFLSTYVATGQPLTSQRIFDNMVDTYETAKTYQDRATVLDVFYESGSAEVFNRRERKGTIVFDRATSRFRFEYEEVKHSFFDPANRYLVWSDGRQVKTWWTMHSMVDIRPSLEEALSAATGVSGNLSHYIPGLLLSDSVSIGWSIGQMTQLRYTGKAKLNERECYQISGLSQSGIRMLLWIDQKTYWLLGIDKGESVLPNGVRVLTTMRFEPVLNQPIAGQDFTVSVPRFYWLWFWPTVGSLLRLIPLVVGLLWLNRLFSRWRKKQRLADTRF